MTSRTNRHVVDELSPYLEDELAPGERKRVEDHLADCAGCRGELELIEETKRVLAEPLEPGSSHEEFLERLERRIDEPVLDGRPVHLPRAERHVASRRKGRFASAVGRVSRPPRRVFAAAAFAATIVLAVLWSDSTREGDAPPPPSGEQVGASAPSGSARLPSGPAPGPPGAQQPARDGVAPVADGAPARLDAPGKVAAASERWRVATSNPPDVRRRLLALARNHRDLRIVGEDPTSITLSLPKSQLPTVREQIVVVEGTRVVREKALRADPGRTILEVLVGDPRQVSGSVESVRP